MHHYERKIHEAAENLKIQEVEEMRRNFFR
jgi:hypothetical protein